MILIKILKVNMNESVAVVLFKNASVYLDQIQHNQYRPIELEMALLNDKQLNI